MFDYIKKIVLVSSLPLLLTGCVSTNNEKNSDTSKNSSEKIPQGKMNVNDIKASQVGLSDEKWNQSRGTDSDGKDTNSTNEPTRILTKDAKSLIVYFSRSGSTELLASKVQSLSNADVLEIVVSDTYSSDYYQTVQRANGEREQSGVPLLNTSVPDLKQYDTIYLGYPIWAMTLAEPMTSFLEQYGEELSGKIIVPFSTNGSYGIGSSVNKIEAILKDKATDFKIAEPYTIEGNKVDKADESLITWFNKIIVSKSK
ncbi:flavodoxin family protein [Gemella cuniculi]|uniref:flavodoxin family protein n=1 Tax=Gemella cuniculi TaxID=150240 RepID=UPI00042294A5|nr:flavodoxin [Gemella cuniculi]